MTDATSDIEDILNTIKRKPSAHQFKKVEIPPIITCLTEILGGVGIERPKFVGHHGSGSRQVQPK